MPHLPIARPLIASALLLTALFAGAASAQTSAPHAPPPQAATPQAAPPQDGALQISWEVRNRFRLFREERDFQLQVEAMRGGSVLAAEQALGVQSDGRGWARNTVNRLCIDATGRVNEPCTRDGVKESYLTPTEHPVTVRLSGPIPVGATCAWTFEDGDGPRQSTLDCGEPINFRARYGRATVATVDVSAGSEAPQRVTTQIAVRDIFIAGLGDSIASGEGNPDKPVALSDEGFCFRSYTGGPGNQYFRPNRAGFKGDRSCESSGPAAQVQWQRSGATWFNTACHRSLYSYQTRAAIALAVQHPHIAVTLLPLACTGATIASGLLGGQRARECLPSQSGTGKCQTSVNAQLSELREALDAVKRRQPDRKLDLVLLSIGANDINFSGLVADVIVDNDTERAMFKRGGMIGDVDDSRAALMRDLPQGFAKLRDALRPLVGPDLSRVLFVSYANPTLGNGATCPGGPAGFDVHPSFSADPKRLSRVSTFVEREFLPALKNLALCRGGILCRGATERMTLVDAHQDAFADHGFCVRAQTDPEFDRQCFSAKGDSFNSSPTEAASQPLACGRGASEFRSYLPRGRWIRDANDSYFTAMTFPQGLSAGIQPADIHDATWGVVSAVYGGAIHPTAEGHAAMADAVLPAAESVLRLGAEVTAQPLPQVEPAQ